MSTVANPADVITRHRTSTRPQRDEVRQVHVEVDTCSCGWTQRHRSDTYADHLLATLREQRLMVVALPDSRQPTPALIEAAYVAQDDLSTPPEPWAIQAAAEVIDSYIQGQHHDCVHVLGHPAAPDERMHGQ